MRRSLLALALVLCGTLAPHRAGAQTVGNFFFGDPIKTADPTRRLFILAPLPGQAAPGGFVIDRFGNFYISDQGDLGNGDGSIVMLPSDGRTPIRFITGLTQPGDLELSPDQRTLIIGLPHGQILRVPFGLSVHVLAAQTSSTPIIIYAKTDVGTKSATVGADGYAHIPNILVPDQLSAAVDLVIERNGTSHTQFGVFLGAPGDTSAASGQTIADSPF